MSGTTRVSHTSPFLSFPLYQTHPPHRHVCSLATRGATFGDGLLYTYRNVSFTPSPLLTQPTHTPRRSLCPVVPGPLLAGYVVELPLLGRRGTLTVSTRV